MRRLKTLFVAILILFLASLFCFIGSWIYVSGKRASWKRDQQQIQAWKTRQNELLQLKQSGDEWEKLADEYRLFRKERFLSKTDFANFRQDLEALIKNNNLVKNSFAYGNRDISPINTERNRLRLNVSGDYPNIKKFIYELENLPWMLFIEKIDMKLEKIQIIADLELEAHFAI